jgi:hypothetical protein
MRRGSVTCPRALSFGGGGVESVGGLALGPTDESVYVGLHFTVCQGLIYSQKRRRVTMDV